MILEHKEYLLIQVTFDNCYRQFHTVANDSHIFQEVKYHTLLRRATPDDVLYSSVQKMFVVVPNVPEKLLCDISSQVSGPALKKYLETCQIFDVTHMTIEADYD